MVEIPDSERLYRRVLSGRGQVMRDSGGRLRISSMAFEDRGRKPSVDRESLCAGGAEWTRQDPANGVLAFHTGEVRAIDTVVQRDARGREVAQHHIEVEPAPLDENPAHCQIVPSPEYQGEGAFRKLREALALLAVVQIAPRDVRD